MAAQRGLEVETRRVVKTHVAHKDDPKYDIRAGDTYESVTVCGYRIGGGRWMRVFKRVVKREENTQVQA